jgi:hypothetical protein
MRADTAVTAVLAVALWLAVAVATAAEEWTTVHRTDDLVIEARPQPGSPVKVLRAEGRIASPPSAVWGVVADVERSAEFIPYVKKSAVLSREGPGVTVAYQRLSFGAIRFLGVDDRDYVIRMVDEVGNAAAGRAVVRRRWTIADVPGPAVEGDVVRLKVNQGSWYLEPTAGEPGADTIAVYCLFTDPGGSLPAWVVNRANQTGIPDLFRAIRETARDPRYAGRPWPPALPARAGGPFDRGECPPR